MTLTAPPCYVMLSPVEWAGIRQRPQQLARQFAREASVLYVNPFGLRSAKLSDLGRLWGRLRAPREAASPTSRMTAVSPFFLPLQGAWAAALNARLVAWQLKRRLGNQALVLVALYPTPLALPLARLLGPRTLVYDCLDHYAGFHANPTLAHAITTHEAALAAAADVVFASSALLGAKWALAPERVVRNGAEVEHFAPPALAGEAKAARRVLGYVGMISSWFDFEAIEALARAHPHDLIRLVGPAEVSLDRLLALPNVEWLGPKPYDELPALIAGFDLCLIPFRLTALTEAVNPVKVYEYLAAGKPVVSAALPEVVALGHDKVATYRTLEELLLQAELSLTTDSPERASARVGFAREHSWEARGRQMRAIIEEHGRARA